VVAHRAPFVFMSETFYFLFFFLWRCGGMMLLGMALHKWGFLDGSRPHRVYVLAAATCIPTGLALAWYGVVELERVRFGMPERIVPDLWNYTGAVFASVGYAAALILIVKRGVLFRVRATLRLSARWRSRTTCCRASSRPLSFWAGAWVWRADSTMPGSS
jgi:uncharacterized membrane protein YeiB